MIRNGAKGLGSMDARLTPQQPQQHKPRRHKGLFLGRWIIIIIIILTIISFSIAAYLILKNQGITQGFTTLTIISIMCGVIIGLLALMIAYFQWRYPVSPETPDTSITSLPVFDNHDPARFAILHSAH